jgi:tRNA-intron endonuclease, archaea type
MNAELINNIIIINDEKLSNSLHSKGYIGTLIKGKLELSGIEALYLLSKEKIIINKSKKEINKQDLLKYFSKKDKRFILKYKVFTDLRNNGYVVKTALKYGFDFRVYNKGIKPGQAHAIWLIHCISQNESLRIGDYSKLIRVCHSVKKKMLLGIVDDESDVTYWESAWTKMK